MNRKDFIREAANKAKREWLESNILKDGEIRGKDVINAILGANIRRVRTERKMSLQDVIDIADIGVTTKAALSLIELGEQNPTVYQLYVIAKATGVKCSDLLNGIE